GASAGVIAPLLNRVVVDRSWLKAVLPSCPNYFIGAGLAVGLVELLNRGRLDVLPVAAVPLYCVYRAYCRDVKRLEDEYRRREVIESLNEGMSVVDNNGRVMLWNETLERMMDCPRERALGRHLAGAVPVLGQTQLPRAIADVVTSRRPRALRRLELPSAAGVRIFEVKLLPVAGGVTLLWHDLT